jgi:pre-mRNA-splicing factor CWC26
VVGKGVATFQKSKNTWATVGSTSLPVPSAAAGPSSRADDESHNAQNGEGDVYIKPDPDAEPAPAAPVKQLTKRKGGLRTAAQLREEAERAAAEREPSPPPDESGAGPSTTTVHRDASGRIVDVEKLKAEAKRAEEEEAKKTREREEWSKGLVQRQRQKDRIRQEMEMDKQDVSRWVLAETPEVAKRC